MARRWTCWCMLCGAREVDLGESLSPEFPRAGDGEAFECRFLPMGIAEVFSAAIYAASEETLDSCDRTMTGALASYPSPGFHLSSYALACWADGRWKQNAFITRALATGLQRLTGCTDGAECIFVQSLQRVTERLD